MADIDAIILTPNLKSKQVKSKQVKSKSKSKGKEINHNISGDQNVQDIPSELTACANTTFMCPVYGSIELPLTLINFYYHPYFQRLRRIKQNGLCYLVFNSMCHTRMEHSLGVMHLAGIVVDKLRMDLNIQISKRTKELIQLAGLYHDIGHTAFSHMFDFFVKESNIEFNQNHCDNFFSYKDHEDRSLYLLKLVNCETKELSEEELEFVSNLIIGNNNRDPRYYLYEIINNAKCGIDVDKMDYVI